ncbi:MAG: zinc ribbon domain-containing protein [Candidatus Micrarchaeota archaeon]
MPGKKELKGPKGDAGDQTIRLWGGQFRDPDKRRQFAAHFGQAFASLQGVQATLERRNGQKSKVNGASVTPSNLTSAIERKLIELAEAEPGTKEGQAMAERKKNNRPSVPPPSYFDQMASGAANPDPEVTAVCGGCSDSLPLEASFCPHCGTMAEFGRYPDDHEGMLRYLEGAENIKITLREKVETIGAATRFLSRLIKRKKMIPVERDSDLLADVLLTTNMIARGVEESAEKIRPLLAVMAINSIAILMLQHDDLVHDCPLVRFKPRTEDNSGTKGLWTSAALTAIRNSKAITPKVERIFEFLAINMGLNLLRFEVDEDPSLRKLLEPLINRTEAFEADVAEMGLGSGSAGIIVRKAAEDRVDAPAKSDGGLKPQAAEGPDSPSGIREAAPDAEESMTTPLVEMLLAVLKER